MHIWLQSIFTKHYIINVKNSKIIFFYKNIHVTKLICYKNSISFVQSITILPDNNCTLFNMYVI